MDLTLCPTNELKTLPLSPLDASAEAKLPTPSAPQPDAMESLVDALKKRTKGLGRTRGTIGTAAPENEAAIRILVEEGATITPDGRLLRSSGRLHRPYVMGKYFKYVLSVKGQRLVISRARIVCWLAQGAPTAERPFVDHINRIAYDDSPSNLRWVSRGENSKNISAEALLARQRNIAGVAANYTGENSTISKLTDQSVMEARRLYATGDHGFVQLGLRFGVKEHTVAAAIKGQTWKHLPLVPIIRQRTGKGYYPHRPRKPKPESVPADMPGPSTGP